MTPAELKIKSLAETLKCDLFATRKTIREAIDYALDIAKASENPPATITAVYVVLNTIANTLLNYVEDYDPNNPRI
jgi:hypothetical protein